MRRSILSVIPAVILAVSAGACAAPERSGAPGTERALRAELDDASCEDLRAVMAEALRARADDAGEDGGAGTALQPAPPAPRAPASMFIPIPGPGLLSRLFSAGPDETAAADPETVYRAAHEAYAARGCAPEVPFGES